MTCPAVEGGMQPGSVLVVEAVTLVGRYEIDDGALGQAYRLVEHETTGSYRRSQRMGHAGSDSTVPTRG